MLIAFRLGSSSDEHLPLDNSHDYPAGCRVSSI